MEYYSITNKGLVRENNQDSVITSHNLSGDFMALVCDGIGGHKAGDVASFETVTLLAKVFSETESFENEVELISFIRKQVSIANKHVYDMAKMNVDYQGMGTTITGVFITSIGRYWINVGDSRVYVYDSDFKLKQLSDDHTYVNELIKSNLITKEQAKTHKDRNKVIKAIGIWDNVDIDYGKIDEKLKYILVSSDGLHGYVDDELIVSVLKNNQSSIITKANDLLKSALDSGGYDNISIILIRFDEVEHEF